MNIYERIKMLCELKDVSISEVEKDLGFSRNTLYKWKDQNPSIDRVLKVAEKFDVPLDFLVGRTDKVYDASEETIYDLLHEINIEKFSELLVSIKEYYALEQTERSNVVEYAIYDYDSLERIGSIIDEPTLVNDASKHVKRLESSAVDGGELEVKAYIRQIFTGNHVSDEMIFDLINKRPSNVVLLSSLLDNIELDNHERVGIHNNFSYSVSLSGHINILRNSDADFSLRLSISIAVSGSLYLALYTAYIDIKAVPEPIISIIFMNEITERDSKIEVEEDIPKEYIDYFQESIGELIREQILSFRQTLKEVPEELKYIETAKIKAKNIL